MTDPIAEASYTDRGVKAGAHYTYTVVAVDKAGNRSAPSNQADDIR
jgi:chitin-binding protein